MLFSRIKALYAITSSILTSFNFVVVALLRQKSSWAQEKRHCSIIRCKIKLIKNSAGGWDLNPRTPKGWGIPVNYNIWASRHHQNIDDVSRRWPGLATPARLSSLCYFCLTRIILLFFFLFDVNWHAAAALALELKGHFKYAILVTGPSCSCIYCFWQLNCFMITRLSRDWFDS